MSFWPKKKDDDYGFIDMILDKIVKSKKLQNLLFRKMHTLFSERGVKNLVFDATTKIVEIDKQGEALASFGIYEFDYDILTRMQEQQKHINKLSEYIKQNKAYIDYGRRNLIAPIDTGQRYLGTGATGEQGAGSGQSAVQ